MSLHALKIEAYAAHKRAEDLRHQMLVVSEQIAVADMQGRTPVAADRESFRDLRARYRKAEAEAISADEAVYDARQGVAS